MFRRICFTFPLLTIFALSALSAPSHEMEMDGLVLRGWRWKKQNAPGRGNSFGKKTSTISLAPALARKYSIPIIPMFTIRCEDTVHHRVVFLPEIQIDRQDNERTLYENTQRQNDVIERVIRERPDHWLWFHRKWQCYHPEIYEQ